MPRASDKIPRIFKRKYIVEPKTRDNTEKTKKEATQLTDHTTVDDSRKNGGNDKEATTIWGDNTGSGAPETL